MSNAPKGPFDAKRLTERLLDRGERCSVVGTSHEAKLAKFASLAARVKLKDTVHKPGVYSLALKLLDPKKEWDAFVWEIGTKPKVKRLRHIVRP